MENLDTQGRTSMDPRDLVGRIYVGDHYLRLVLTLLCNGKQQKVIYVLSSTYAR